MKAVPNVGVEHFLEQRHVVHIVGGSGRRLFCSLPVQNLSLSGHGKFTGVLLFCLHFFISITLTLLSLNVTKEQFCVAHLGAFSYYKVFANYALNRIVFSALL